MLKICFVIQISSQLEDLLYCTELITLEVFIGQTRTWLAFSPSVCELIGPLCILKNQHFAVFLE